MKEAKIKQKENVENVREAEVKTQVKLSGNMKLHKGHTIWEFNTVTYEIQKAEIEKVPFKVMDQKTKERLSRFTKLGQIALAPKHVGKVIEKENCVYVKALKIEGALKKLGIPVKMRKIKKQKDTE